MDISLVGDWFSKAMPHFPWYYFSYLFLQLFCRFIVALVDTFYCDHNIFIVRWIKEEHNK